MRALYHSFPRPEKARPKMRQLTVPPFSFFDASMQAPILITDTAVLRLCRAPENPAR